MHFLLRLVLPVSTLQDENTTKNNPEDFFHDYNINHSPDQFDKQAKRVETARRRLSARGGAPTFADEIEKLQQIEYKPKDAFDKNEIIIVMVMVILMLMLIAIAIRNAWTGNSRRLD